ncbi:MAG: dihydropteroate synthase [Deltaproteobacteria bacterium]|nr:dihydropteroate synthase [Deltaproteobacteria bacterium]
MNLWTGRRLRKLWPGDRFSKRNYSDDVAISCNKSTIMGVLNVTPDSFSDGGDFFSPENAVNHALKMVSEGADIIDIGGESSRPGSEPVSADEELSRVLPIIRKIRGHPREGGDPVNSRDSIFLGNDRPIISIDTTKAIVASEAISAGAGMINDISAGTSDEKMLKVAAKAGVSICLMHMRGSPKTMQRGDMHYDDVIGEIKDYLSKRILSAEKAGVKRENIIIDPGIGFGKTVEHNVTILKELKKFKTLGCPILIGTSRKSFIGHLLGGIDAKERLEGTLATIGIAVQNGASIVRAHDVKETKRFLEVLNKFC